MAAPKTPRFRLRVYAEQYPSSLGTDLLVHGHEDLDEATYVEGRVIEFGPIETAISDPSGEHFAGQASIRLTDTDHFYRARGAVDATRYLGGRDAILDCISAEALALALGRTIVMRGKTRGLDPESGLTAQLLIEELIGSEYGTAYLDKLINPRKFRREVFPNLPKPLLEQHVPIIIGEVSDEGSLNPDGTAGSKGLCPGFYVGDFQIVSTTVTPGTQPPLPAPSWAITYATFGSGGSHTYTYAVSVRTATGRTPLGGFVTISGLPSPSAFSSSNGVKLFLAQYPAAQQALVVGVDLYVKDGGINSSAPYHFMDGAGEIFNTSANTPFAAGPNFNAPIDVGYEDNGDDQHYKTRNPPPTGSGGTGSTATPPAQYGLIIFADSACVGLVGLFGSDGGGSSTGIPVRQRWQIGAATDVIDPTSGGWPHPNPWIDIVGTDGVTERFFGIYVKGPRLQHHIDGRVPIWANICGRPQDAGNINSPLIDQFARVWQHVLSAQVFGNNGLSYFTGNTWPGLPTFADGVEAISSPSVQAAEAKSEIYLGDAIGYKAGFCLTKPMTVREFLRVFNRTFTSFSCINEHGQLSLHLVDTLASPTAGTAVREHIDDVVEIGAPREMHDWIENKTEYRFDWDAAQQKYRSDLLTVHAPQSQVQHGAAGKIVMRQREQIDGFFTRDGPTMASAIVQRLLLYDRAARLVPITMGAAGLNVTLFQQLLVTAHEGYGPQGYVLQPMLVVGRRILPGKQGLVELTCWDLNTILTRFFGSLVSGQYTWTDGSIVWGDGTLNWPP